MKDLERDNFGVGAGACLNQVVYVFLEAQYQSSLSAAVRNINRSRKEVLGLVCQGYHFLLKVSCDRCIWTVSSLDVDLVLVPGSRSGREC